MTKCCTKRPNCDIRPKCDKKKNVFMLTSFIVTFNIFFVIFRILLIKREELHDIPSGYWNHFWWYLMFILFLEIQLLALYCWYYITLDTIKSIRKCLKRLKYNLTELLGIRITNPFMKWMTLINTDWWIYKILCVFGVIFYTGCILFIIFGYLFVVFLFGPYLLGYYKMNHPK